MNQNIFLAVGWGGGRCWHCSEHVCCCSCQLRPSWQHVPSSPSTSVADASWTPKAAHWIGHLLRTAHKIYMALDGQNRHLSLAIFDRRLKSQPLAHQNRTIAIASDFRVDGANAPEIPQKEGVLGSEIAARNRRSLATFHRTLKSQCIIAVSCLGNRAISGVRDGHRNRKHRKHRCDFGALSRNPLRNFDILACRKPRK